MNIPITRKKKRKNKKLRSVRTPWPRAKYFPIQPSHSVNKYILCSTEKDKTWSNDPSQRDLGVKLAIGENLKLAPFPCATSKWPTPLPGLSIRFHTYCSCAFVRSCVFSFIRRASFTLKSRLFLCEISVRNYPLQKKSAVWTRIAWKCHAVKSQCEETPLRIFWLVGHFVSSLLAEVSHEEAKCQEIPQREVNHLIRSAHRSTDIKRPLKQRSSSHLFWLKYGQEHSGKKVKFSYVQEIKLRRNRLVARICHLVNMANRTQIPFEYKINLIRLKKTVWV